MLFDFAFLAVSVAFLVKFSNMTIDNAENLSKIVRIGQAAIGFIFIAISTSLPELMIGIISSLKGEGILSVGNLFGANIANITIVFGVMSLLGFKMAEKYRKQIRYAVILTSMVAFIMIVAGTLSLIFGMFCLSLFYIFSEGIIGRGLKSIGSGRDHAAHLLKHASCILVSIIGVIISAHFVTNSAIALAMKLGVAESLVAATILSMGTTLPELSISASAVRRGDIGLAVGNVVGSLVANLTFILGTISILGNIALTRTEISIAAALMGFNILFMLLTNNKKFGYREAAILFSSYGVFLFIILILGW
ncbi:MAG: sodium:calcium antiporter [Candidatus Aenigmarchaeota archaeon]|nr:sodium:calcium antiporter [Candidatus Aenigmarchaeota archaeon]